MHWWPARTPFEVIVGAILTQSTSWGNVERAIANLRAARDAYAVGDSARVDIATGCAGAAVGLLPPEGEKTESLRRNSCEREYGGSLKRMFQTPTAELREKLLSVHGIGPETADSILLYAGNHPVFVVDAYTHRIFGRHGITDGKPDYEDVRARFESALPRSRSSSMNFTP